MMYDMFRRSLIAAAMSLGSLFGSAGAREEKKKPIGS